MPKEIEIEKNADQLRKTFLKYTRKAFETLPKLDKPRILDIGCGSGIPTLELARLTNGEIIGIDIDLSALDELDEKALKTILTQPQNALVKQYIKLLELENTKLIFEDDALKQIVKIAKKRNTGARALRAIMEDIMLDIMYKLPSINGVESCTITSAVVLKKEEPILTFKKSVKTA